MSKARNMARMGQDASAGYTGAFDMPAGTTAERPASAGLGWTRLNTDTGSVEVYDGTNWNAVTRPFISSVTGTIYAGAASNLVIAGQNFTSTITVRFLEGGSTVADVSGVVVSSGSGTVAVPAAVYGQTAGDSIEIKVINSDGTMGANGITKTVQALPTGGTITISGGYRYHTFTSSNNFVVPSGFTATADALIVAGGGSGGSGNGGSGGGGAGGMRQQTGVSITAQTYSIVVGAGGAGTPDVNNQVGNDGSSSSGLGFTSTGGGGGGAWAAQAGRSGGSGGGGGGNSGGAAGAGGGGTSGQGNAGGAGINSSTPYTGGGGGGAGAVGGSTNGSPISPGGAGLQWLDGNYYAGGGGAGTENGNTAGNGGIGGGGRGGYSGVVGSPGSANTGGGGGGGGYNSPYRVSGAGGSGIVIIRYAL